MEGLTLVQSPFLVFKNWTYLPSKLPTYLHTYSPTYVPTYLPTYRMHEGHTFIEEDSGCHDDQGNVDGVGKPKFFSLGASVHGRDSRRVM